MSRTCRFGAALACSSCSVGPVASPDSLTKHHALSLIGTPRHGPDFTHFDWVNPNAPKGGRVRAVGDGHLRLAQPFPIKVSPPSAWSSSTITLMMQSPDEAGTSYGLVAEWVAIPRTTHRRPCSCAGGTLSRRQAHHGRDVIYSSRTPQEGLAESRLYYKNVAKAEKTGDTRSPSSFRVKGNRELPDHHRRAARAAQALLRGVGANGEPRDLVQVDARDSPGLRPYRIKEIDPGRSDHLRARQGLVGEGPAVAKGQWNFDELKFVYFRERVPAFEASRRAARLLGENSAKDWATAFDFDAVKRGW
jgi:microcin C transport system substrate-binding protein